MAKELYLSPTYVSKYIRKHCGMRFMELLTAVRLSHAVEDLLYFDSSIMKIALDNGFSSVAACNKAFKDAYHMTPSQFRKKRSHGKHKLSPQEAEKKKRIEKSVDRYLNQYPQAPGIDVVEKLPVMLKADEPAQEKLDTGSLQMINAGLASNLLNTRLCQQIIERREAMGFSYVRFWDIYAPELYLDANASYEEQNYSKLDIVTDFLVKHHLKPYIDLGALNRSRCRVIPGKVISYIRRDLEFFSEKHLEGFYQGLARHFVSRYGEEEVSSWYFELWERTNFTFKNPTDYQFKEMSEADHKAYFSLFNQVAGAIRQIVPGAVIGGGGFPVRMYGAEGFAKILSMWKEEDEQPDFISITCYP